MRARTFAATLAGLALTTAALTACSSDITTGPSSQAPAVSASPAPTLDDAIRDQVNVKPGAKVKPGSISSTKQAGLGPDCVKAVEPLRHMMGKYKSGLLITSDKDNKTLTSDLQHARKTCMDEDRQAWLDFYAKEFLGWLNASVKN